MIMNILPQSEPNSGPATVNIFSRHGAVRYAFWMSHASTSRPFKAAIVNAIRTLSLDTTEEYVRVLGVVVL